MKLRNVVLSAIVCSLALPVMAASIAKAGKWETTVQMEMPNMPMKIPAHTMNVCVTKEQAENLSLPTQLRACEEYCRRQG